MTSRYLRLRAEQVENDALVARGESADGLFAELSEPVPTIRVGERDTLGHLVNVGFGVVLLCLSVCLH